MDEINKIEKFYKKYIKNINFWIPEGVLEIDLSLLQSLNLLHHSPKIQPDSGLTRYFNVIETKEKITLVNEQFIVWIVPERVNQVPVTYTLIALNHPVSPKLELAFAASGVYNTSRLVLRVLEKYLVDIQETEEMLSRYGKVKS
jgi:hypothetical protein